MWNIDIKVLKDLCLLYKYVLLNNDLDDCVQFKSALQKCCFLIGETATDSGVIAYRHLSSTRYYPIVSNPEVRL